MKNQLHLGKIIQNLKKVYLIHSKIQIKINMLNKNVN